MSSNHISESVIKHVSYRRYSCAGFVIEAYRAAGMNLVNTVPDELPKIGLEVLNHAYPDQADHLADPATRARFGLSGDGPWAVVLAGYVVNSLNRSSDEIRNSPHRAIELDAYFPHRTATSSP